MEVDEDDSVQKVEEHVQNVQRFNGQLWQLVCKFCPKGFRFSFIDYSSFSNRCSCPNSRHPFFFFSPSEIDQRS